MGAPGGSLTVQHLSSLPMRRLLLLSNSRDEQGRYLHHPREAMAEHFAGRFNRAHKAAQRALAIQAGTDELAGDRELRILAHLLAARRRCA